MLKVRFTNFSAVYAMSSLTLSTRQQDEWMFYEGTRAEKWRKLLIIMNVKKNIKYISASKMR